MADQDNKIFREKSLERISSPEELDKYIKSTTPTIIILVSAIAVLFAGLITWNLVGKIESKSAIGFVYDQQSNTTTSYIKEVDYNNFIAYLLDDQEKGFSYVKETMYMQYGDYKISIDSFSAVQTWTDSSDNFLIKAAGITENDMYREIKSSEITFGVTESQFKGKIVYSLITPINLFFE